MLRIRRRYQPGGPGSSALQGMPQMPRTRGVSRAGHSIRIGIRLRIRIRIRAAAPQQHRTQTKTKMVGMGQLAPPAMGDGQGFPPSMISSTTGKAGVGPVLAAIPVQSSRAAANRRQVRGPQDRRHIFPGNGGNRPADGLETGSAGISASGDTCRAGAEWAEALVRWLAPAPTLCRWSPLLPLTRNGQSTVRHEGFMLGLVAQGAAQQQVHPVRRGIPHLRQPRRPPLNHGVPMLRTAQYPCLGRGRSFMAIPHPLA